MGFGSKAIKNFDSYGRGVSLNINGKESVNSFCGGIFTLINTIFFIAIFLNNLYQFLFVPTPLITISEIYRPQEEIETISDKDLMIADFFFFTAPPDPPTPIQVKPTVSNGTEVILTMKNSKVSRTGRQFGKFDDCSINKLYTDDNDFLTIYDKIKILSDQNFMNCFKFTQENFTVGGNLITSDQSYRVVIESHYDLCSFVKGGTNCTLTKQNYTFLSTLKLMTLYKNHYIDKDNPKGYDQMFDILTNEVDFKRNFMIKIIARRANISTDNNIIYNLFPNNETETLTYTIQTSSQSKSEGESLNTFTLRYEIELENYTTVVERSYLKLDEMLANVGSIVAIIEILVKFLADFFSQGNFEHSIYKEVFHIKKKKLLDVDPKIFSGIHKFKSCKNNIDNINVRKDYDPKQVEIELKKLDKDIIGKDHDFDKNFQNRENMRYNFTDKIENPNTSIIDQSSSRNINEQKHLKNDLNDISLDNTLKNNQHNNFQPQQENKVYDEFKKILKEKTIKKSNLVGFYQLFSCCFKKNTNMKLLINLQDFITEELDIVKIIKKLIEYEHFKGLFLTEKQIKIFNLMQKRILSEEVLEDDASDYYIQFYFKNKMKELKSFKHLVDHLSNVDEENQYSKPILEKLINSFSF